MQRTVITCLALVALLTQALVSAAPHAVLCIKGGADACGTMAVKSECSCCCADKAEPVVTVIRLCTPCHEQCDDCVEVDLPDETMPAAVAPDGLAALAFLGLAFHTELQIDSVCAAVTHVQTGTDPPGEVGPAERVIETTRLLL